MDSGTLTITGPGARALVIDGNAKDRVFEVDTALTATGLTIRNGNADGDGGGIEAFAPLTLDHVTVTGNVASGGGGILFGCTCPLNITNSSISGNRASRDAGLDLSATTVNMTNVTVANNMNTSGNEASGIEIDRGQMNLNFVTVAGNGFTGATDPADLQPAGIGVHGTSVDLRGRVNFHNTIVANNGGVNCRVTVPAADTSDVPGRPSTDQGYNLDSANDCGFSAASPKFDQVKANPILGALGNNGGQTNTMALGASSPAINAADPACSVASDQRGVTRPQASRCDIGAFEVLAAVVAPSPSPTPVLPRAGQPGPSPARGLLVLPAAFAVASILALARVLRLRTKPRP